MQVNKKRHFLDSKFPLNFKNLISGTRMMHLVDITGAIDFAVIVTRWYGGIHLGGDRWKHINNALRQILEDHDMINRKK